MSIYTYNKNDNIYNIPFFKEILECANNSNATVYFVGGCVRDLILQKDIKDIDITVFNIDYQVFAKNLSKKIKSFFVPFKDNIRLSKNNFIIDVSKPRGNNINEDLMKRDFTINNLALDSYGNIIGNKDDINNKIIKKVNNDIFDDDPLRILRSIRFVSTLGFDIDKDTLDLAIKKSPLLKNVAKERITEELYKTFFGKFLSLSLPILNESKILNNIFNGNLDYISPLNVKNKSFPLYLSLFANFEAIKSLCLSSKDEKLILYILNNFQNILNYKNMTDNEKKSIIWNNYDNINYLVDYIIAKYPLNKNDFGDLNLLKETLNIENAKKINGDLLKKIGFKPSPIFAKIIKEVSEKLALNLIDKDNIEEYILKNYKQN